MAQSSILGTEQAPRHAIGRDADVLGPSDSSDSGSDIQGELHLETDDFETLSAAISGAGNTDLQSDSDAGGTGERGSAVPEHIHEGADIAPDRVILSGEEALETDPELVSIDDPEAVDLDNLVADEEYSEEDETDEEGDALADPALATSGSAR
ncbi:hypothetical protein [Aquabacterium sp. CECT 9606]|uniref:hypothetical protein n=1 Tax=Aquabacterium sp. CECT 9606 TaxID=2845822 RepID=UPI001E5D46C0|nr:hypothetical protein [Aquabacterium sp. CECT 9606]CAH0349162.1 hypothetical protein AQB9606_00932 [Aquabacterium sp. CECT 9606]